MVGIKSVRINVEVNEQMSPSMVAAVLRELAAKVELSDFIYTHDLTIFWTPESDSFESQ